jgi:hypothetical protein
MSAHFLAWSRRSNIQAEQSVTGTIGPAERVLTGRRALVIRIYLWTDGIGQECCQAARDGGTPRIVRDIKDLSREPGQPWSGRDYEPTGFQCQLLIIDVRLWESDGYSPGTVWNVRTYLMPPRIVIHCT